MKDKIYEPDTKAGKKDGQENRDAVRPQDQPNNEDLDVNENPFAGHNQNM